MKLPLVESMRRPRDFLSGASLCLILESNQLNFSIKAARDILAICKEVSAILPNPPEA